jgi:hypothetical protein
MAAKKAPARQVRHTVLLVGEGLAEVGVLNLIKALYVARGSKAVTVKNAKGHGGRAVLDYAHRQSRAADYDETAVLLDTDADWDDAQRALAKRSKITVFEATPCLEAVLLRIAGHAVPHSTTHCKRDFKNHYGAEAHEFGLIERHFDQAVFDAARDRVPVLDSLIGYLQKASQ